MATDKIHLCHCILYAFQQGRNATEACRKLLKGFGEGTVSDRTCRRCTKFEKTERGWFFCVRTPWAKYGVDSGAGLHRNFEGKSWMFDGLIGLNALSLKLRSHTIISYFTVLDRHSVLDWLYSSYMGRLKYEWLDWRFYDSQWQAPIAKPWFHVPWKYPIGDQGRYNHEWIYNK